MTRGSATPPSGSAEAGSAVRSLGFERLTGSEVKDSEAFLFAQAIDATSYERQRDRLREELTLAQIDHHAEAVDELDVEGILAFAVEGVAFDGNRFNRTATTATLFKYLAPFESAVVKDGEPNVRQLEPDHGMASARRWGSPGSVSGYSMIPSVSDKPKKTNIARLRVFMSSDASDPTSFPRRLLGTAVTLSTIIRHGAFSPFLVLG